MRVDGVINPTVAAAPGATAAASTEVDPKLRSAALQFEELLVRQLTQILADTAKGVDEEGADSASSFYANQLPDALASAIKDAGGLGLATELERAMRTSS
jgi:Rod binding domain-containing protein